MNGGTKILAGIKTECDENVNAINLESQKAYDKAVGDAKETALKESEKIKTAAEKKAKQLDEISKSRAELEFKNSVLKRKRQEIDKTYKAVLDAMLSLDDKDYFELIYKLASTLKSAKGEILLNQKDINRLPSDFEQRINAQGINAKVNKNATDICGGFILKNGDIEENMDFSAVLDSKQEMIEDLINRSLFAE